MRGGGHEEEERGGEEHLPPRGEGGVQVHPPGVRPSHPVEAVGVDGGHQVHLVRGRTKYWILRRIFIFKSLRLFCISNTHKFGGCFVIAK